MSYSLTSPVPEVQNVGVAEQAVSTLGKKPVCTDGEVTHFFGCFGAAPTYVHYVNSTGEASAQLWVGGYTGSAQSGVRGAAYNPYNNKMYIGGAFLFEIDLNDSPPTFTVVKDSLGVSGGLYDRHIGVSNGGLVWYTEYSPSRKFYIFDPNPALEPPDNWKDYGDPYAAGVNIDYQYSYAGVDDTYIYFACPNAQGVSTPNRLFYCPIAGTPNWQQWQPTGWATDLLMTPFCASGTTNWYILRRLANSTDVWYTAIDGVFTETTEPSWPGTDNAPLYCYPNIDAATFEGQQVYGWQFDFSALVPIKDVWENSVMSWDNGVDFYQSSLPFAGTSFVDNYINATIGVGGSNFLCLGIGYSAAVNFDPAASVGNRTTYIGAEVLSPYTVKKHPVSGEIYCGGYANKVWRFTPDLPLTPGNWTFNPTYTQPFDPADDPKPNPYLIDLGARTLHYRLFIDFDAAGLVWIGGNTVRISPNWGDAMWYNPSTGASAYVLPTWEGSGRQIRDLCAANNRSIICVSNDNGQIYLIDAATQTLDGTPYIPVVGGTGSIWMIEVSTNVVLGIYVHYDSSTYKVFTFNPSTKTTIIGPQNFGVSDVVPFGWIDSGENNRRYFKLELGPDGYVWMFVGATLYRINPATCEFESVVTLDDPGKLKFASNNTDLLIHYSTAEDNFYIPGILTFEGYSKGAYPSLPGNDDDLLDVYTDGQITDVATDDIYMVAQLATSQIAIHQFKQEINGIGGTITVVAQVTIPCSTSTAYLQIYNRSGTPAWDTIDSDNATGANTDFTLSATVADLTDYKDENNIVACRVYQEMQ